MRSARSPAFTWESLRVMRQVWKLGCIGVKTTSEVTAENACASIRLVVYRKHQAVITELGLTPPELPQDNSPAQPKNQPWQSFQVNCQHHRRSAPNATCSPFPAAGWLVGDRKSVV